MKSEEAINWRVELESKYVLICKYCGRKVFDPDKGNKNQVFTKNKCPHCGLNKELAKQQAKQKLIVAC